MGTRTIRFCDLDANHEATRQITFSLDGEAFLLDVCKSDGEKIDKMLAPVIKASTSIDLKAMVKRFDSNGNGDLDMRVVREWLVANGHNPPPKGRIAGELVDKYRAAHKK